jgi:hypothetical protein
MNYQKIYNQLINRAKHRVLDGYKERHHIVPRCIGGDDEKNNLVELTAREHFVAHKLLCEIYPDNDKLFFAYWGMCTNRANDYMQRIQINSREYERARKKFSEIISILNTGESNPAKRSEVRIKISNALMGHTAWNDGLTKETNDSIASMAIKQKTIKRWNVGLTKDDPRVLEQSKKSSQARTGKKRGKYMLTYETCPYCNQTLTKSVINKLHKDKCKYKF